MSDRAFADSAIVDALAGAGVTAEGSSADIVAESAIIDAFAGALLAAGGWRAEGGVGAAIGGAAFAGGLVADFAGGTGPVGAAIFVDTDASILIAERIWVPATAAGSAIWLAFAGGVFAAFALFAGWLAGVWVDDTFARFAIGGAEMSGFAIAIFAAILAGGEVGAAVLSAGAGDVFAGVFDLARGFGYADLAEIAAHREASKRVGAFIVGAARHTEFFVAEFHTSALSATFGVFGTLLACNFGATGNAIAFFATA